MIELLVVISIISLLAAILVPVLSKARRKAKMILGMNNQRQIARFLDIYAADNEGRYPESVATVGTGRGASWQDPRMMTGYYKRSPNLHRSMGAYLRSYIEDGGLMWCPNAPTKYRYLQEAWDSGEYWDNPDTSAVPDAVWGSYCFYWNYVGFLGGRSPFRGPSGPAGGRGEGRVLVSDYFGYGNWRSQMSYGGRCYGSCERLRGADITKGTDGSSAYWSRPTEDDLADLGALGVRLSACYVDGHVERYSPSEAVPMKVSLRMDGSVPYPDGQMSSGTFCVPRNGLR